MLTTLYTSAVRAATPLLEAHLKKRAARGREDVARAHERHGKPQRPRGRNPLVWCHGASVGEAVALLSVVDRISKDHPGLDIMVTTGTVTSAKTLEGRLPPNAFHQYIPVDHPDWVAAFLDHWRPDLVLWTESDFWPAMLCAIKKRGIPAVLLNGCMSEPSFRKWQWGRALIADALSAFDLVLAQNMGHAQRLAGLGARNVKSSANLKYAAAPLSFDAAKLSELQTAVGGRPVIVWASAHPGEDAMAARLHAAMKPRHPHLLTVIVPRHIAKGPAMQTECAALGLHSSLRSTGALPSDRDDVYIADTMGEMGLFFRLGKLAIVGGSFCFRSHNPIEPAQLGRVVFFGPETAHIDALCADFESRKAALRVRDEADLQKNVAAFLADPAAFDAMAENARAWTADRMKIADEVMADLAPYLLNLIEPGRKTS